MEIAVTLVLLVLGLIVAERAVKWLSYRLKPAQERALIERARRARPDEPTRASRGLLKGCANCGAASLTLPHRDASGAGYCSEECLIWGALGATEFCPQCLRATTNQSPGDMHRVNGVGRGFGGIAERCPRCRSVVRRIWFTILYAPLIPLARYRVIQASPTQFFARRLR